MMLNLGFSDFFNLVSLLPLQHAICTALYANPVFHLFD